MRRILRLHLSAAAHSRHECWCQSHSTHWYYAGPDITTKARHKHPPSPQHARLTRLGRLRIAWRMIRHTDQQP